MVDCFKSILMYISKNTVICNSVYHFSHSSPIMSGFSHVSTFDISTAYCPELYFFISCSNSILLIACFIIERVLSSCFLKDIAMYSPNVSHSSFFLYISERLYNFLSNNLFLSASDSVLSLIILRLSTRLRRGLEQKDFVLGGVLLKSGSSFIMICTGLSLQLSSYSSSECSASSSSATSFFLLFLT